MPKRDQEAYKTYMNNYMKDRWTKRRADAVKHLGGKCKICNETENLEFDHIDATTKINSIAKFSSASESKFWNEVNKCQLLCKEHHVLKSRLNGETGGGSNRIDEYGHGTWHMYTKDKCRCPLCFQWRRDYRTKLVDSMGRLRITD